MMEIMLDVDYHTLKSASNCLKSFVEMSEDKYYLYDSKHFFNDGDGSADDYRDSVLRMKKLIKDIDKRINYEEQENRRIHFAPHIDKL